MEVVCKDLSIGDRRTERDASRSEEAMLGGCVLLNYLSRRDVM